MRNRALSIAPSTILGLLALLASSRPVAAARLDCSPAIAVPGGIAVVEVSLSTASGESVTGTQNDIEFDEDLFDPSRPDSPDRPDCRINPAIGPGTAAAKMLASSLLADPARVRAFILALGNLRPIPAGPLYTCNFRVASDTPLGEYRFANVNLGVAPRAPVEGTDCVIDVVEPSPTPTPIQCDRDEDCPSGQVCVGDRCVTATPTPTPTVQCDDDQDCPGGQVCAGNRCVTPTPTPTPPGFCVNAGDCPIGQVCVNNRCATPTVTITPTPLGFCVDVDDCPEGEVCVNNRCATVTPTGRATATPTPPGFCVLNDDCPEGEVCVNNRCATVTPTRRASVSPTPDGFCTRDDDCSGGAVCVGNACVTPTPTLRAATATPIGFCLSDTDCAGTEVCLDRRCVTPTPTKRKGGGGGCAIDARPEAGAGSLAWLVALALLLIRRVRSAPAGPRGKTARRVQVLR